MTSDKPFDLDFVRQQFPEQHWQWAFFENAGGAFVPNSVIQRMTSYMTNTQVQPGYPYPASTDAAERMALGQLRMTELIGAEPDEVTISPSTSINIYVLAQALRGLWKSGDEIIVSTLNHEANSGPWRRLAEFGINIIEWPVDSETARLDIEQLDALLSDKTRLVAFPHVSNITGDINDVAAITAKVHDAGAMVCVDGVAYAPHRAVDVKAWDVDFYLFSYYKVFGPHLGCMYGKKERLLEAKGQYHYFFDEDDVAHKLNPAGPNHESISALVGIADYFDALCDHHFQQTANGFFDRCKQVYGLVENHEQSLAKQFLDFVDSKPAIRLIGTTDSDASARVPTFSIQIENLASAEAALKLAKDKVAISSGHFYAKRLLDSMNLTEPEVLRCSMAHYNTEAEVALLIKGLDRLC